MKRRRRGAQETRPRPGARAGILEASAGRFSSRIVDHIDHIVKACRDRHVGIGSDFDGISCAG